MTDRMSGHFTYGRRAIVVVRFLAPFLWALCILWLSQTSSPPEIPGMLGWDKLLHAGAFGLLSLLTLQLLVLYFSNQFYLYATACSTCILYGGLIELCQLLSNAGRTADWWDFAADAVGVFLACVVFRQGSSLISRHAESKGHLDG